jgi:ADP-ribosylglycohydrolase
MKIAERFEGCIIGGAIGDAFGNTLEQNDEEVFYLFGKAENKIPKWKITDDTQLTLATCEAIIENAELGVENFANKYLEYYKQKKISGIGASTLKAFRELEVGGHWTQVGRKGEYAAGNGAAMRIAPIAFLEKISREEIRDICSITHNNDEAYIGALCVVLSIQSAIDGTWMGKENLIEIIIDKIPDTKVRDRLIEINKFPTNTTLSEIGKLGNSGYVVDSIPLAIAAANNIGQLGIEKMFTTLIEIGGDTDTNCSIAGQIAGSLIGIGTMPDNLFSKLKILPEYKWINNTLTKFIANRKWG